MPPRKNNLDQSLDDLDNKLLEDEDTEGNEVKEDVVEVEEEDKDTSDLTDKETPDDDKKDTDDDSDDPLALDEETEEEEDPLALIDVLAKSVSDKKYTDLPEVQQLVELKQEILSRGQSIERAEAVINNVESEFNELLAHVGMDAGVFKLRSWPNVVLQAFQKKFAAAKTERTGIEEIEDEVDEDAPLTRRDLKKLMEAGVKDPRVDKMLAGQQDTSVETIFNSRFDNIWGRIPLFVALEKKDPKSASKIKGESYTELKGNAKALLGEGFTGVPLQNALLKIAQKTKDNIMLGRTIYGSGKPEDKKKKTPPMKGGKATIPDSKGVERPKLLKEIGGRTVKVSTSDAIDEFDDAFDKALGAL